MNKLRGDRVNVRWIDPRTGDATPAGGFPNTGVRGFATPSGWEDALLVLECDVDA
jgi:hypothetical protein